MSLTIGAGANLKIGGSLLFNFKNNRWELFAHKGVLMVMSSGFSYLVDLFMDMKKNEIVKNLLFPMVEE